MSLKSLLLNKSKPRRICKKDVSSSKEGDRGMSVSKTDPAGAQSDLLQALASIAAESWRLDRVIGKVLGLLDPMDSERFAGQYKWFQRKVNGALHSAGITVVDLTGQPFIAGMAVTPLNVDETGDGDAVIAQMIEPVVMANGAVLRFGTVLLAAKDGAQKHAIGPEDTTDD